MFFLMLNGFCQLEGRGFFFKLSSINLKSTNFSYYEKINSTQTHVCGGIAYANTIIKSADK